MGRPGRPHLRPELRPAATRVGGGGPGGGRRRSPPRAPRPQRPALGGGPPHPARRRPRRPRPPGPAPSPPERRAGGRGEAGRGGRRCLRLGGLGAGRRPGNMAAEAAVPALPNGGAGAPSGTVPVLFCFSVFARPSSVPHGAGYELLIQKFLSLYGDQLDMHRKFVVQLFAEEWGQYVDLPKGFAVSERCKVRLVPLQIQVGPAAAAPGPRAPGPRALLRCPAPRGSPALRASPPGKGGSLSPAAGTPPGMCPCGGEGRQLPSPAGAGASPLVAARDRPHVCGPQPPGAPGASPSLPRSPGLGGVAVLLFGGDARAFIWG